MISKNEFPEGKVPLGAQKFQFSCHAGVECFMSCCKNVDMFLFPYDVLRLKNRLGLDSETFMRLYARLVKGDNLYFPSVMLKLNEDEEKRCPFLQSNGCSVYKDRPSACRTYPLERAVDRNVVSSRRRDFYFLTHHEYCLGHQEKQMNTVSQWIREQQLQLYNNMNEQWTELDTIFASNPWKGEGSAGPKQQMAFMVCYNIDEFRVFVARQQILEQFKLSNDQKKQLSTDDAALLQFGFSWLKLILSGSSSLQYR